MGTSISFEAKKIPSSATLNAITSMLKYSLRCGAWKRRGLRKIRLPGSRLAQTSKSQPKELRFLSDSFSIPGSALRY